MHILDYKLIHQGLNMGQTITLYYLISLMLNHLYHSSQATSTYNKINSYNSLALLHDASRYITLRVHSHQYLDCRLILSHKYLYLQMTGLMKSFLIQNQDILHVYHLIAELPHQEYNIHPSNLGQTL